MDGLDKRLIKGIVIGGAVMLAGLAAVILVYNNFIWPHTVLGDQAGTWEGHVYRNTVLNLRVEVPENWTVFDEEEAMKRTAEAFEVNEEDMTGGFLVSAADEATGTQLNLSVEMGDLPPAEDVRVLLERAAEVTANGTAYQIRELEDMTVAGRVWKAWYIDYPELSGEEYALFREVEDYVVELAVIGAYSSDPVKLLEHVTRLEN